MSARLAAAFTTCQIAFGVIASPQILSSRLILRKIVPPAMAAAPVHSSTARFAHNGTGKEWMGRFPLPTRVSNHAMSKTRLEWVFTVLSLTKSFSAISRLLRPWAISSRISSSRRVIWRSSRFSFSLRD